MGFQKESQVKISRTIFYQKKTAIWEEEYCVGQRTTVLDYCTELSMVVRLGDFEIV